MRKANVRRARMAQPFAGGVAAPSDQVLSDVAAPSPTLANKLRMQISDEIIRGLLPPGSALDETDLAHRFSVSRTPVREAIRMLASSGLVEVRPHRSALVSRPSDAQIKAMFESLRELEGVCAAFAAERMTASERAHLARIHRSLSALARNNDPQDYFDTNEAFHNAIYEGAHNSYIAEMTQATRARIAPFSRAQFYVRGRLAKSHAEHAGILAAIVDRHPERARAAMRAHIGLVHESYLVRT